MAVIAVTADNVRIAEGAATPDTGTWGNDGGGGGVADEPDFFYQGTESQSRKISTTRIGRSYTHGSGTDMDAANREHYICKIQATNKDALLARTAPALGMKIGSASNGYREFYLYGNDNYPKKGGWQIVAINPKLIAFSDANTGVFVITNILYFSVLADFSGGSKSENVMIDAIDIGAGLHIVGGDGADPDGDFQDFVDFDEGTAANSFGYVSTEVGILLINGRIAIGQSTTPTAVATVFKDSDKTIVWQNGLTITGFHRLLLDLGGTGTDIDFTRCTFESLGKENNDGDRGHSTTQDSRTIFEVTGTVGVLALQGCSIINFSTIGLNSKCSLHSCNIIKSGQIDAGSGADISGSSILVSAVAADASALLWNVNLDPNGELDNLTISKGALAHHAIEFGTTAPLTMTLTGWDISGFNALDAQNDSALYFDDRGSDVTWTVNIIGGSGNFKFKKARAGDTVNIVISPVPLNVTVKDATTGGFIQDAKVNVEAGDALGDLFFEVTVTITSSGTLATVAHTAHGLTTGAKVNIQGANLEIDYTGAQTITVTGVNSYTYVMANSTTSPASTPINATEMILSGNTDINGEITASRTYTIDQKYRGQAVKADASPFYKASNIAGTLDKDTGANIDPQLILDE